MAKIIGIDDAGRGPVLGSMVLAGVLIDEGDNNLLREWGAKDSKLLTPKNRGEIKKKIISQFKYYSEISSSEEIDNSLNLNYLEAIKTAKIINNFMAGLDEKVKVIVDCPSVNIPAWSRDVEKLIKKPELVLLSCEHKADINHPSVSAASIIAKERREDEIYKLKQKFQIDFGSGYPSDPKTKKFIEKNFENSEYKKVIRYSWNTVKRLIKAKNQKSLF